MTFALCYWILMLLWLIFGVWSNWPVAGGNRFGLGNTLLLFILFVLLGWKVFGAPLKP